VVVGSYLSRARGIQRPVLTRHEHHRGADQLRVGLDPPSDLVAVQARERGVDERNVRTKVPTLFERSLTVLDGQ